jgi:hypothetical protein
VYSGEYDVSCLWCYSECISTPGELVVGSIPTVAGHIFQARPVWIYTQRNSE